MKDADRQEQRRNFVSMATMLAGLAGSYGLFGAIAARFLYPAREAETRWMYVVRIADLTSGTTIKYQLPSGEKVNVTRQGHGAAVEDFVALSSTCPHLGCQVHWEPHNDRFFCPCHNGVFTPSGEGIGGPPGDAGMRLPEYALRIESGLLYIAAPVGSLTAGGGEGRIVDDSDAIHAAGHDPCLAPPSAGCEDCSRRA